MAPWYQLRMREGKGGISAGSLAVQAHPFWVSPAGKPVPGGEEEGGSPQLDTDTHTWFSRGSAGSVHSPRGLLGSTPRGLADLGFPADSLGGSHPFSSRPGDRQLFSDPSNWAVRNRLVTDSEVSRGRVLPNSQHPTLLLPSPHKGQRRILGGHAYRPACLTPETESWTTLGEGVQSLSHTKSPGASQSTQAGEGGQHEKPLKLSPSTDYLPFFHPP